MATCGAYRDLRDHGDLWIPSVFQVPATGFKVHAGILGFLPFLPAQCPSPTPATHPSYSLAILTFASLSLSSYAPFSTSLDLAIPIVLSCFPSLAMLTQPFSLSALDISRSLCLSSLVSPIKILPTSWVSPIGSFFPTPTRIQELEWVVSLDSGLSPAPPQSVSDRLSVISDSFN